MPAPATTAAIGAHSLGDWDRPDITCWMTSQASIHASMKEADWFKEHSENLR